MTQKIETTDRELLELAAKAAGIDYWVVRFAPKSAPIKKLHITKDGETVEWNPLTDDGDALRLAVKLKITLFQTSKSVIAEPDADFDYKLISKKEYCDGETRCAATRRAIVRAAAAIGKEILI